jgi:ABC-2 type transport system permease protein
VNGYPAALWVEALKARRSKVPWLAAAAYSLVPFVGGLFMFILKNPDEARQLGLITAKAQLTVGAADWPAYLDLLAQATAVGGVMVFSIMTAWIFGREFTDNTAKELLAVPTARTAIVAAKFTTVVVWAIALVGLIVVLGLGVGLAVGLPGWSSDVLRRGVGNLAASALLTLALMPPVAFLASTGRGYLPPLGWAILTVVLAQIIAVTGWGSWFPWAVPALFSGLAGPRSEQVGPHSYVIVALVLVGGIAATVSWWRNADQTG